jgi:hypothetical protein
MDQMMNSGPAGQMMGKKVGGKMTIGQYVTYQKKHFMYLLIAAIVVGALSLIPAVSGIFVVLGWLVYLYAAFVYFWFGYQMAKEKKGELRDVLIGGAVIGLIYGLVAGIFRMLYYFIVYRTIFSGFGVFGVGIGPSVTTLAITGLIYSIIGAAIGGLIVALIGFAVGGGFNKGAARQM